MSRKALGFPQDTPHPADEFTRKQQQQGRGPPQSSPYPHRRGHLTDNMALTALGSLSGLTPRRPTEFPELDNFAASAAPKAWEKVAYCGSM